MAKIRIDDYLIANKYFDNKEDVLRYVMAGKVFVNEQKLASSAKQYKIEKIEKIRIKDKKYKYVSRAGYKLEKAIKEFKLELKSKIMLDVGSSTGGFVDCALQEGISEVYALDVGTNQLDYSLRINDKVKVFEKTNFRLIDEKFFNIKFDIITMDVSFISIKLLVENVKKLLKDNGEFICLIKPQFEAERDVKRENGIITDPKVHEQVVDDITKYLEENNLTVCQVVPSPIKGTKGNQEFLAHIKNKEV